MTCVPSVLILAASMLGQDSREIVDRQLAASRTMYTTPAAWATRRTALREGFLKGAKLWPLPEKPPLNSIRRDRRDYDGYTVENVALETMPGFYLTGNLYLPRCREGKGPAVLCPHGHFQPLGRFREEHQIRCAHLARMGATVFSYGMVGWQDSMQTTHDDPLVLALQTWNSIRAVDFVTSLPGVDPKRVGVTGASGGGSQALFLTLVDERVKVSAPVVIIYPWTAPDGCLCEGGMPVMQATQTNAIELAAAAAPRPQLLISCGKDPTQDFPKTGFPFIKLVYKLHGKVDSVANVHFDQGHDYGPGKRQAMYLFFAKHLGLDLLEENAKTIPIEPPERMRVFDDKHPLPKHAIQGAAAVAKAFAALKRVAPMPDPKAAKSAAIEAFLFTPAGFDKEGQALVAPGANLAKLRITISDAKTGQPTACRINVVGPDGNFYQPQPNDLTPYALTGWWPKVGRGNRAGTAPIRYYGRFFYSRGESIVEVPAGAVRVEVWKGMENRPETVSVSVKAGHTYAIDVRLMRVVPMSEHGYYSGDAHLHLPRTSEADDDLILDLLQAEDIRLGSVLAYNEPAGPYAGFMERMDTPQLRGMGEKSIHKRGDYQIISGQEYRSTTYGHLNLYLGDDLVLKERKVNANDWPLYGDLSRQARQRGGYAFYAHGGYSQAIYADLVQGNIDGVELLQFGIYRGIGLEDWYRVLNAGYRFPAIGASDYPACRKFGDCITYVHHENQPTFNDWYRGAALGRSFITSGPLLLLEVDGHKPGAIRRQEKGPMTVTAKIRVRSEVAPVTNVQLIVGGKVVRELVMPTDKSKSVWLELKVPIELKASSWIAARAFSKSPTGEPDAEAHTNPVYVYLGGKAPYDEAAIDVLSRKVQDQMALHARRDFPEKLRVLEYFERSRKALEKVRQAGGMTAAEVPVGAANGQDEPATSAEQFKALVKEFYAAANLAYHKAETNAERNEAVARIDKLTLRLLELAEKNPKDPIALDALVQAVTLEISLENNSTHPGWGKDSRAAKAIAILLRDHLQNDKLGEACRRMSYGFSKECETFLRTVLAKSPHPEVQALACLRLAQFLNRRVNRLDLVKEQPEMAKRYEGLFGKEHLEGLQRRDRTKAIGEAETFFELAIAKYGNSGTVAEQAKTELFEIRHLTVGREALDIDGRDQDGKRFKLSDYRGKVVLLYFWSEY